MKYQLKYDKKSDCKVLVSANGEHREDIANIKEFEVVRSYDKNGFEIEHLRRYKRKLT